MTYAELAAYADKRLAGVKYITVYEEPVVSDSEEFWNSVDADWKSVGEDF